eukprot:scaffold5439_cov132-Cylindrotheca_fusiformis.AAC.11
MGPVLDEQQQSSYRRIAFQDISNSSTFQEQCKSSVPKKYPKSKPTLRKDVRKDKNDPLCKNDYVQEMYRYFSERESSTSVRPLYMEQQSNLNEQMRSILVDWLVDVHYSFRLALATLHLTVNLIDRYLEISPGVARKDFQLVGITALWIASKYEDIRPIDIYQLIDMCEGCYTKRQIFRQERNMLLALHFQIAVPTSLTFLLRFLKAANANRLMAHMSMYILEETLGSYNLLHYLPSQMAAASVYLARKSLINENTTTVWSSCLEEYTEYKKEEVLPVAKAIWMERTTGEMKATSVQKKYTTVLFSCVATIPLKGL